MCISSQQKALVQNSFTQVIPIADQAARLFYERLFELNPSLRSLFATDMSQQRTKLVQTLHAAVQGLDDLDAFVPVLQSLAKRHVNYGVRAEHYTTVGAALLSALEQGLGEAFTDEVRQAWSVVYSVISSVMLQAVES